MAGNSKGAIAGYRNSRRGGICAKFLLLQPVKKKKKKTERNPRERFSGFSVFPLGETERKLNFFYEVINA